MLELIEVTELEATVDKEGLVILIKKTIAALKYSITVDPDYAHNYEVQIDDYNKVLKKLNA